jgi:hypothetical protein
MGDKDMAGESMKSITDGVPEFFYDLLAYVIPAVYLTVGLVFISRIYILFSQFEFLLLDNIIIDVVLAIIGFGGLYFIGQILTTFSSFIVWKFPIWIYNKIFTNKAVPISPNWYDGYRKFELEKPYIASLITKRYSRWVSSRNMVLANIILLVLNLVYREKYVIIILVLILIFLIDSVVRKKWLNTYISKLASIDNIENI